VEEDEAAHLTAADAKHGLRGVGRAGDRGEEDETRCSSMVGGRVGRAPRREAASAADEGKG
jgi:hypothetical protein